MATPSEVLAAIQPYLIAANRVNTTPLYNSNTGTGQVWVYKIPGTNPQVLVVQASGAVDCDGAQSTQCNINTDPEYQADTSCHTSGDLPMSAATIPWYVLPVDPLETSGQCGTAGGANQCFSYRAHGIDCAQSGLVIYGNSMKFGVFADENGDPQSIGEMSYAMASAVGIDPNPKTGGVDSGVTYIVFTGASNRVSPPESLTNAQTIGNNALNTMLNQISGGDGGGGYDCTSSGCISGTQYPDYASCVAACPTSTGGKVCSPACAAGDICLASIGINKCVKKYVALGGGALLLLLLLRK